MGEWRFPSNDYGEIKGINDTGIAMFSGTPLQSLAREVCQNSLDASANKKTTIVEFNLFQLDCFKVPGRADLLDAFTRGKEFWKKQNSKQTEQFLKNANKSLSEEIFCDVLRISDHNTTGLLGSDGEINTDWTNLTKSSGASDKSASAGGSFGIGKFAPFACSKFNTVFYSTYDQNNKEAYQGVTRLVTFNDKNNNQTQGIGYFGEERNKPIIGQANFDENYKRSPKDYGTDIYIFGFKFSNEDWKKDIIVSILDGFLGALWRGKLEIKIENIKLNKNTLGTTIEQYKEELLPYTKSYYEVLISKNTKTFKEDFKELGEVELKLLLGKDSTPNKVSMIRKTGMKILEKEQKNSNIPFAGIMFINGEKLNEQLRQMENPEHTKWEPARAKDPKQGRQLLKELYRFINQKLDSLINENNTKSVDAAGVGIYLPDNPEDSQNGYEEVISDKINGVVIKEIKTKSPSLKPVGLYENIIDKETETEKEETETTQPTPDGNEEAWERKDIVNEITETGERPPNSTQAEIESIAKQPLPESVGASKIVLLCTNKESGCYTMKIIPDENAKDGVIQLYLSAETDKYKAPISKATINGQEAIVEDNAIKGITLTKEQPLIINLEIDYNEYCPMEVEINAIKD